MLPTHEDKSLCFVLTRIYVAYWSNLQTNMQHYPLASNDNQTIPENFYVYICMELMTNKFPQKNDACQELCIGNVMCGTYFFY